MNLKQKWGEEGAEEGGRNKGSRVHGMGVYLDEALSLTLENDLTSYYSHRMLTADPKIIFSKSSDQLLIW